MKQRFQRRDGEDRPAELVEHSDVGIHVVDVVGVGRVLDNVPLLWLGALGAEHVAAVLGLVIHAVKACHLQRHQGGKQEIEFLGGNGGGLWMDRVSASPVLMYLYVR